MIGKLYSNKYKKKKHTYTKYIYITGKVEVPGHLFLRKV